MAFGWKLYGDGKTPPLGEAVAPDERLSWPRTIGIGAQHVVAMFGATFVFPIVMGLDPNLDRKSTRLNSSHANISYAVFCLKKKGADHPPAPPHRRLRSRRPRLLGSV